MSKKNKVDLNQEVLKLDFEDNEAEGVLSNVKELIDAFSVLGVRHFKISIWADTSPEKVSTSNTRIRR